MSDPTDHALATIASILDQAETHREVEEPVSEASLEPPAIDSFGNEPANLRMHPIRDIQKDPAILRHRRRIAKQMFQHRGPSQTVGRL